MVIDAVVVHRFVTRGGFCQLAGLNIRRAQCTALVLGRVYANRLPVNGFDRSATPNRIPPRCISSVRHNT